MIRSKNVTGINVEHNSSAPGVKASTDGVYGETDNQDNIGAGEWCPSNVGAARRVFPDLSQKTITHHCLSYFPLFHS